MLSANLRCSEWQINGAGPDYDASTYSYAPSYHASNGLRSNGDMLKLGPRTPYPCDPSMIGW